MYKIDEGDYFDRTFEALSNFKQKKIKNNQHLNRKIKRFVIIIFSNKIIT